MIYVAESDEVARDDMRECYNEIIAWEIVNTPHHQVERIPPGGTFQDINFDYWWTPPTCSSAARRR